jgi:hypothetical protein
MGELTDEEVKMLRAVRDRGFAVVIFTPEELQNVPPGKLEDDLIALGWDTIDTLRN